MNSLTAKGRDICWLAGAWLVLVPIGCATGPPKSGFLKDYSGFEKIHDDAPVWSFIDPEGLGRSHRLLRLWGDVGNKAKLAEYDRFMVDPMVVRLNKNSAGNWVSPSKVAKLAKDMDDALIAGLSKHLSKADEPGKGVLRFRHALTDIWPMYVYDSAQDISAVDWANSSAGGSTFEAEAVDSVTGERVFGDIAVGRGGNFDPLTVKDLWANARHAATGFGKFIGQKMKDSHAPD